MNSLRICHRILCNTLEFSDRNNNFYYLQYACKIFRPLCNFKESLITVTSVELSKTRGKPKATEPLIFSFHILVHVIYNSQEECSRISAMSFDRVEHCTFCVWPFGPQILQLSDKAVFLSYHIYYTCPVKLKTKRMGEIGSIPVLNTCSAVRKFPFLVAISLNVSDSTMRQTTSPDPLALAGRILLDCHLDSSKSPSASHLSGDGKRTKCLASA